MKRIFILLSMVLAYCTIYAQNVGIGNTSPLSKLDISGDIALREGTPIAVAAGANAITLPAAKSSVYRLTGAGGAFSITSISGGNEGMLLTLINATGQVMTVTNGSIQTNTGADLVGSSTVSAVNLQYNATLAKWLVSSSQGFGQSGTNIYNTDGTLTGTRTVTMGANNINLNSTGGNLTLNGGKVGIGTASPAYPLDVSGTLRTAGYRMQTGAATGYVLTSDTAGNGTWAKSDFDAEIAAIQAANYSCPSQIGVISTGSVPYSVAVSGSYAYVVDEYSYDLRVYNVSNPASPSLTGSATTNGYNPYSLPISVAVSGSYAYVLDNTNNTMLVYNVSNPAHPYQVTYVYAGSLPDFVTISGSYAYVVGASNDLLIYNVSNPSTPLLVGSLATGASPASIAVSGSYAYVVDYGSNDLRIYDVSNPVSPTQVGSVATGGYPASIAVSGGYAYVVGGSNDLRIYNVSNPASPSQVGSVATGSGPSSVFVSGSSVYVVDYFSNDLRVYNVSNPASPTQLASVATGRHPNSITASGGYVYVVGESNDLRIYSLLCNPVANLEVNTITGILTASTSNPVNSVSNTSSGNALSTTVNGVTGATVPIVNSISNTSSANTILTMVNGVAGSTVPIINSNALGLSGSSLTSTVNGVNSSAISLAALPLAGDVTGTLAATTVGKINGTSMAGLGTGILKNTTATGVPSIAVAADFPTLNQNTTGSAGSFTGSLAGDVTGAQGATALSKIQGAPLTVSSLASGNMLQYNGSAWVNVAPSAISANNIYNSDGTLTGNRTLTMGGNTMNITGGNIGIGIAVPQQVLSVVCPTGLYSNAEHNPHAISALSGTTTSDYILYMGADKTNALSYIQSVNYGTAVANLTLNARGGFVGIGVSVPTTQLANTATNIVGNDGQGVTGQSLAWANNAAGYTATLYNANSAATNSDGLAVKIAGTANTNRILDLSTGAAQATAGTSVMVATGAGNVGIGASTPASKLDVNGAVRVQGAQATHAQGVQIEWNKDGSSGISYILNQKGGGVGGLLLGEVDVNNNITTRLNINSSGAVTIPQLSTAGIVTNTAAGLLGTTSTVPIANGGTGSATQNFVDLTSAQTAAGIKTWSSNANFGGIVTMNGTTQNTNQGIEWNYANNDRYGLVQSNGGGTTLYTSTGYASSFISFALSGTAGGALGSELMRITHAGQVGIGQSVPNATLDVNGNIQISNSTIPMGLMTELPGTTAPLLNFDVNFRESNKNTAYIGAAFRIDTRGGSNNLFQWLYRSPSNVESIPMVLSASGNLGINTTSPAYPLDVNGAANIASWANQSIGANGYARMGGVLIEWGTGPYTSNSATSITFPLPFTNVFSVTISANDRSGGGASGANIAPKILTTSTSGFNYGGTAVFSGDATTKITWMAIGN